MWVNNFCLESKFPVPVESLFAWHERPGAIQRLSPPWDPLEVIDRFGGIRDDAWTLLRMRIGPVPYLWQARHRWYEPNRFFQDVQERGPFRYWTHSHRFAADGPDQSWLMDQIEYALPGGRVANRLAGRWVNARLRAIFRFRHQRLFHDLELLKRYPRRPLRIVIAGSSGLLGSSLVPFLTTAGHDVYRLVRRPARPHRHEIEWDPARGRLAPAALEEADAVINLAGDNLAEGKWTPEKKQRVIKSRVDSTSLLAETINRLDRPPRVFVSASAIGYYGDRADEALAEDAGPAPSFVSQVCTTWEEAACRLNREGVRSALLRIGVVLTPQGGALSAMLPAFRCGLGGRIGSGRQFISWIHIDDLVGALYHVLQTDTLSGPINLCAPEPVPQQRFAHGLAAVLGRPALLPLPAPVVTTVFGEKGKEILLAGARVVPAKLQESGYTFRFPVLEPALEHLLGRF